MIGANHTVSRRKSELATWVGEDSTSHHRKGDKKWEEELKPYRMFQTLKFALGFKREVSATKCVLYRGSVRIEYSEIGFSKSAVDLESSINGR